MYVLRDGTQLDAGIAHDAAEADGRAVSGDDALDGECDSKDAAAAAFDFCCEIVDDTADFLVIRVSIAVGESRMMSCNDIAMQIDCAQAQLVGAHGDADGGLGL